MRWRPTAYNIGKIERNCIDGTHRQTWFDVEEKERKNVIRKTRNNIKSGQL